MSSLKVEIVRILDILEHPKADRLEIAQIKGWQCVIGKGTYKKGDKAIYIPIDSILSKETEEKLFPPDSKIKLHKSRVRTIKLRGIISQGMLAPLDMFELSNEAVGVDVAKKLGITKYEPPVKANLQGRQTDKKQTNPYFNKYTSIENIKNYPDVFDSCDKVVITEKIHGTNFRAGWVKFYANTWWKKILKFLKLVPKYGFVYGSHNVQLQDKMLYSGYYDTNVYVEAVKKYDLKNKINKGIVIYGEIYGDGIQKNYKYGCKVGERKLVVFDVKKEDNYFDHYQAKVYSLLIGLPFVPIIYSGKFKDVDIEKLVQGKSVLSSSQKIREGVVVKSIIEQKSIIGRKILKCINPKYLLNNNTDFH